MQSKDIREAFLAFFESKKHKRLPSSSLIPSDKSVLLTIAGMLQFKPIFLGTDKAAYNRVTTCQKCVRVNDIEEVGKTTRHHTFFEMLGNFSFGDYFKEDAILFAWEFLTIKLKIKNEKLKIAVFKDDNEAFEIWNQKLGISKSEIYRLDEENNFWSAGPTGPCGPCSEIYYDFGMDKGCRKPDCAPGCDCERFLEIWNLVFIEFNRDEAGNLNPLPKKNIDTGMGLERITRVMQNAESNFDTDLFLPLIEAVLKLSRKNNSASVRVIADHCRAAAYLIADGVTPSNEERGYVLRRLIRRAVMHGKKLGIEAPFLWNIVSLVIAQGESFYPELRIQKDFIKSVILAEEKGFQTTLATGIELIEELFNKSEGKVISGVEVFKLHDTYGFPYELTQELAQKKGLKIDKKGFEVEMQKQRERARANVRIAKGGEGIVAKNETERAAMAAHHTATHLLHAALRQILGKHVFQSGSLVDPKHLRFDFSNPKAMTKKEIEQVEDLVNQKVRDNIEVDISEKSFDEAKKMGAMALFGEKYGERVRIIEINNFSIELCGGCHVRNTQEIKSFKIIKERAIAAGVRRIEAVTGKAAEEYIKHNLLEIEESKKKEEAKEKQKAEKKEKERGAQGLLEEATKVIQEIKGINVLAYQALNVDMKGLRVLGDAIKDKLQSGIILLASSEEQKCFFLVLVTDDLVKKGFKAGDLVKIMAKVCGGGGGGRPNKAEAGGRDPSKIEEAL
ncbi:MAG: alanine--tRNA ligase, partial [Candidatus Saganbacteria bacterium]|nr:alanine--tRNA ligase [Candidatus Saganbacteria bacterium]